YKLQLNYAFIMGYRFDVSIYRGRVIGIDGMSCYAAHIKKLIDLKDKYHRFFYEGKFVVNTIYPLPKNVIMTEYEYEDETLLVFMNKSHTSCTFEVPGRIISLEGDGVYCMLKLR
ncbi:MAG TPA: hypothetical protein DDY59_15305, partial [Lachnospiraceae bacterium]|nr:hypothetical protein [Lachnospiraceae bacterium]